MDVDIFLLKTGDTTPSLARVLASEGGAALDLTGATVVFRMRAAGGAVVIDSGAVTVIDAAAGSVVYDWQAGDSATAGDYEAEFKVTYLSGAVGTVPNDGFIQVRVLGGIGLKQPI